MKAVKTFCATAAVLLASAGFVSSFTTTPSSRVQKSASLCSNILKTQQRFVSHPVEATTTSLQMSGGSNPEVDTDGIEVGKYLLFFVMLVNIWSFSIPVEFRRARLCTEEDVRLYPERHCTTFEMWRTGIVDYYKNGGGVDFDFTVEEGNKWVGS